MALPKPKARNTLELTRTDEGNDSLETIVRQAIGKEPLISLSRSADNQVQWIQLLHALDQQDLPGWPLLTPLKMHMQKCEKCLKEFCSSINYRRHIRVHHRLKNLDKDSNRNRGLLTAYWDKLGEDDAKEVLSFKNMAMQEVSGSVVVKSLTALIRKSGFYALPQSFLKAGSALLDVLQSRASRFPLSSDELFSILDDASEKTFLCGPVVSVQKYIFDGDAAKNGLESKNVVAFTSFLVEQRLINAWLADKDAEALRCQKLLMEEEEVERQRQVDLLEKKRQKKLRHKELKAKEQISNEGEDRLVVTFEPMRPSDLPCACTEHDAQEPEETPSSDSSNEPSQSGNEVIDIFETQMDKINGNVDVDDGRYEQKRMERSRKHYSNRWDMVSKPQTIAYGFSNHHPQKISNIHKHGFQWEVKATAGTSLTDLKSSLNSKKDDVDANFKIRHVDKESTVQADPDKAPEVLIGTISVAIASSGCLDTSDINGTPDDSFIRQKVSQSLEKHDCGQRQPTSKIWIPVKRNCKCPSVDDASCGECLTDRRDGVESNAFDQSSTIDLEKKNLDAYLPSETSQFSSQMAKKFLQTRWKETIEAEHVKLIVTPNCEKSQYLKVGNASPMIVNKAESVEPNWSSVDYTTVPENGIKLMYIPKQTTMA